MEFLGIHHVTAITSSAEKNYEFFTNVLGMRLVKKTVNQDDINTYHLFFADDKGSPGTDITFFDFKGAAKASRGNDELKRTSFRVPNDEALEYWLKRFDHYKVEHSEIEELFGRKLIYFSDFDDQLYALISDENDKGVKSGEPWLKGPVPNEFGITGLGPFFIDVSDLEQMDLVLTKVLNMRKTDSLGNLHLYEMGEGGNGGSLYINHSDEKKIGYQGYGGVHHIAFRVNDRSDILNWTNHFNQMRARNSGHIDRFYFESLYVKLYKNILFEIATDGPGFIDDEESYEILGETLALPPKFREHREKIEKLVRHIDTVRSDKEFKKEYF